MYPSQQPHVGSLYTVARVSTGTFAPEAVAADTTGCAGKATGDNSRSAMTVAIPITAVVPTNMSEAFVIRSCHAQPGETGKEQRKHDDHGDRCDF